MLPLSALFYFWILPLDILLYSQGNMDHYWPSPKKKKIPGFFFILVTNDSIKSRTAIQTLIIVKEHLYNDLFPTYNLVCMLTVKLLFHFSFSERMIFLPIPWFKWPFLHSFITWVRRRLNQLIKGLQSNTEQGNGWLNIAFNVELSLRNSKVGVFFLQKQPWDWKTFFFLSVLFWHLLYSGSNGRVS